MLDIDNNISDNLYEIRVHGTRDFPLNVYKIQFAPNHLSYISYHWHPEMEIVYVVEGEIKYSINETDYILKTGEAMLVASNQLHGCQSVGNATWYALLFNPKLLYQFEESAIYEQYFRKPAFKNIMLTPKSTNLLVEILTSFKLKENNYQLSIISRLYQLWLDIYESNNLSLVEAPSKPSSFRLKKALDFIHQNYDRKIKIDDLCDEVCLCRSEVCKLFREYMNTTFTDYLTKFRIEKSVSLLTSNETNITEICDLVGFNSSSYFTEIFKKYYNQTPLAYKKAHMK